MTDTTYEVVLSRYFDAPPDLVYRAFLDPEQLSQWYAPLAFHVPFDSVAVDPRVGGQWRLEMVSNFDPTQRHPVEITFTEVLSGRLLVGHESARDIPGMADGTLLTLSVEFIAEGDGTRLELREGPMPEQMREMAAIGWSQALAKLAALLATPARFRNSPGQDSTTESEEDPS